MLNPDHLQEWRNSAVHEDLIKLNVRSLSGTQPYEYLLYSDALERRNTGRLTDYWLNLYRHIEQGGWWCSGVDVLTGEDSMWGCFKPNSPRLEPNQGFDPNKTLKPIKYEHPPKTPTELFALRVSGRIATKIEERSYERQTKKQSAAEAAKEASPEASKATPIIWCPDETGLSPRNQGMAPYLDDGGTSEDEDKDFWSRVKADTQIPLTITEGAKKAGALLSNGFLSIGLPGIYSGYRVTRNEETGKTFRSLIPQLEALVKGRTVYITFDQDSKQRTVKATNNAIETTANLLFRHGCKAVKIVEWEPGLGKGIDDVALVHGSQMLEDLYESALDFDYWKTVKSQRLTYSIALEISGESKYLEDFAIPLAANFIALKAPKGCGKTEWLAKQIHHHTHSGGKVLVLTHRIQLGEALCKRFGVNYVTELNSAQDGKLFGYGLCMDSLHPKSQAQFNPKDWEGAWIIIDEVEQVIWHLLNSSTCRHQRVKILTCFREAIQIALSTGGKIFLSDADLSDISIDYVIRLAGMDLRPWIVVKKWLPSENQKWNITRYSGSNPSRLVAALEKHIEDGGKPFVCLSGQKTKSQWGTQNLETYLQGKYPHLKILRIDSESIADPQHPAFGCVSRLDSILPRYDVILASPSIETGVSIECKHFTSVWGIFQGVQTPNSCRQFLARIRANVPRHIWAKSVGFNFIGSGSTSIKELCALEHKAAETHRRLLLDADFWGDADFDFQRPSLTAWATQAALVNMGMKAYSKSIFKELEKEGHLIIDADEDELKANAEVVKTEVAENKEAEYNKHCEAVASVESPDDNSYNLLKEKRSKTEEERLQFEKGGLERRYNVEVVPELVKKNDDGWYQKISLHYYFELVRINAIDRDREVLSGMLENGDGSIFKPDMNRVLMSGKVATLMELGVEKLLLLDEATLATPEVVEVANKAKQSISKIKALLRTKISPKDSPMAIAQKLIGLIGYQFPYLKQKGTGKNRVRVYGAPAADFFRNDEGKIVKDEKGKAIPLDDGRVAVFAKWVERDQLKAEARQEIANASFSAQPVEVSAQSPAVIEELPTEAELSSNNPPVQTGFAGLVERLRIASNLEAFAQAITGWAVDIVEDAIAMQDTQPVRSLMKGWLESAIAT